MKARSTIHVSLTPLEAEAMSRFRERLETAGPDVYVLMAGGDEYSEVNRAFFKIRAASDRARRRNSEEFGK